MLGTHPDIAFAVTKLSQHTTNPSKDHLSRVLYICCYLLGVKAAAGLDCSINRQEPEQGLILVPKS
jgi:hypothetical protein